MKAIRNLLFIILTLLTAESFAYVPQEGNVTAMLGPFLYKTNFGHANVGSESQRRVGTGLVATGDLNRNGALEIGLFTLNKSYLKKQSGKYIIQDAELLHITMGYRYYISERFSTSLTFFSAYALGTPLTIYSEFSPGENVDTSAKDTTEYGFDLAGQAELFNFSDRWGFMLEGRYSLSLTPKENERADHFGALLMLRYIISSKSKLD